MKKTEPQLTNIFEKALFDRFLALDIGIPDEKIMEVIERAGSEMTKEVKVILNKQHDLRKEQKRRSFRATAEL